MLRYFSQRDIINMRSPTNIKEVQHPTGCLAALYHFISYAGGNFFLFFAALKKKDKFKWKGECNEVFSNIKIFLTSPPILTRTKEGCPLHLYLSVIDQTMSSVLVHKINQAEQIAYFVSKVFKGVDTRYQKTEKLAMAIVVMARKLQPYFQDHKVLVNTNYPV